MALIDEVTIKVKGGKGGDGSNSFKVNFGSQRRVPDGGSGGDGGSVYFEGTHNLNDLSEFRFKKNIKASDGVNGERKTLLGKSGEDLIIKVPLGTTIINLATNKSSEITFDGEKLLVAKGGRKGLGNYYYKFSKKKFNPTRDKGEEGEEFELKLILNLIADIGIVGLPNAGKSSLLSKLTNATPRIGDYPFTTLEPNLGVMPSNHSSQGDERGDNIIIADIPGLIEGAHEGRGLGISFLKHITKTKMLLHIVDSTSYDSIRDYKTIIEEFKNFEEDLTQKNELIILSKSDLTSEEILQKKIQEFKKIGKKAYTISIFDEMNIKKLQKIIIEEFSKLKNERNKSATLTS